MPSKLRTNNDKLKAETIKLKAKLEKAETQIKELTKTKVKSLGFYRSRFR